MPEKKKILVVDDAPFILNIIKYNLENNGYEVFTGTNGKEGLDVLSKQYVDLILVDVMMPVMDGFSFLETVRKNRKLASVKVIFLTSLRSKEDVKKAVKLGVNDYIMKPFTADAVLERVKKYI